MNLGILLVAALTAVGGGSDVHVDSVDITPHSDIQEVSPLIEAGANAIGAVKVGLGEPQVLPRPDRLLQKMFLTCEDWLERCEEFCPCGFTIFICFEPSGPFTCVCASCDP